MKDLTPTGGPHSHGIATRGQSTCRTDARLIARPTGDVGGLRRQLEHLTALPDPVDHLAEPLATSTQTAHRCWRAARCPAVQRPSLSRR